MSPGRAACVAGRVSEPEEILSCEGVKCLKKAWAVFSRRNNGSGGG